MEFTTHFELQSQATRLVQGKFRDDSYACKDGSFTLTATLFQEIWHAGKGQYCHNHNSMHEMYTDFHSGLFPFQSPLLRESLLVSFPPAINMLKFTGYSCLNWDQWANVQNTFVTEQWVRPATHSIARRRSALVKPIATHRDDREPYSTRRKVQSTPDRAMGWALCFDTLCASYDTLVTLEHRLPPSLSRQTSKHTERIFTGRLAIWLIVT